MHTTAIWKKNTGKYKKQAIHEEVVTKTNDLLEEKLQIIENTMNLEINQIRVEPNNFKIQNDLDIQ